MSLTNLIRAGFFALAILVTGIAVLAFQHSNRSIEAITISLSAIAPTEIGLKQVDTLLAEARVAFLKYDKRDRTTGDDGVSILTKLVETEKNLIANLPESSHLHHRHI